MYVLVVMGFPETTLLCTKVYIHHYGQRNLLENNITVLAEYINAIFYTESMGLAELVAG